MILIDTKLQYEMDATYANMESIPRLILTGMDGVQAKVQWLKPRNNYLNVKEVASKFTIDWLSFRAWRKTEFGNRIIFSGCLACTCLQKRKRLDTIKWIFNLNWLKNLEFFFSFQG